MRHQEEDAPARGQTVLTPAERATAPTDGAASHSPLPWRTDGVDIFSSAGLLVGSCEGRLYPDDAEFVCDAVNSHHAMLNALRLIASQFCLNRSLHGRPCVYDDAFCSSCIAFMAAGKAEGTQS